MTEESAVKVCVRIRPIVSREELASPEDTEPQLFWKADQKSIYQIDDGSSNKSFSFDRVFTAEETTAQVYQAIGNPLVVSTVGGYNGTVFAYGQTSSGKTFTMMGNDHNPGVIPMAVEDVFKTIKSFPNKEFLLRVSYMEIYNETVTDLLVDSWKRKPLEVRETINKNIYVADLTEELVTSTSQVLAWIRKGEKNRQYAKTKMNQRSSRSHAIFRMILESRERSDPASGDNTDGAIIVSHLNLVDLAGSERASQTGAEGARFKEGCNINRSLFTLSQVIKKLTDENQKSFTNYRDSKLTRILQNSLGGNAKTVIICTITPFTLEETLSTLQFASTAKKMKNDPHVTEVSDDGALLKRYRNEIVDLKRRLNEVTSVTQTTVTEKEVLSQLLQEKDQLQREQEDRIRNLTQLLVTSSNLVPVQRMPRRRVTWGGNMFGPQSAGNNNGMSNLTFVEPVPRKWKPHTSSLVEMAEGDDCFDSPWMIPEEPSCEMDTSENFVTFHRSGDSSTDFVSPDRVSELSKKVSDLKLKLEAEVQQKEEAIKRTETLDRKVVELQLQLQTEAQQRTEAIEKLTTEEQKAADLERRLQTETRQNEETIEKTVAADKKAVDLERKLSLTEQSLAESKSMNKEFEEIVHLCETLASEKEKVISDRDYLKQELEMFIEQIQNLEKENAVLSKELKEKEDLNEFESLEVNIFEEQENELKNEVSCLKNAIKASEDQHLELQNKLQTLSEELKKKTEFAEELQIMSGKDLVQEVANLRRSLDDAEGVSRDTKKEWAFLRSENIALEELKVTLTTRQEKMEAELNSLLSQLETEKCRNKKMQRDLQKELNVVFDENTKLTTLLDGRVPQNLIDSVELERTVAKLVKELAASRKAEEALKAELEKLASFQTLPDEVENLTKQVCDLTEELQTVKNQRDDLLSGQTRCEQELRDILQTSKEEVLKVQTDLDVSAQRENELKQQCDTVTHQLDLLHSELAQSEAERRQLIDSLQDGDTQMKQLNEALEHVQAEKEALLSERCASSQSSAVETKELLSTITSLRTEGDELRMDLQAHVDKGTEVDVLLQHLQQELEDQKQKNSDMMKIFDQKECALGENIMRLSQELQAQQEEKMVLETRSAENSAEELEKLLSSVASLTAERDQLKVDLQENLEMMKTSAEELENLRAARDALMLEKEASSQCHTEEMQCRLMCLSEERHQLQETLGEEKNKLKAELEMQCETQLMSEVQPLADEREAYQLQIEQLEEKLRIANEEINQLQLNQENVNPSQELQAVQDEKPAEEMEKLLSALSSITVERDQLKVDLQENVEMMIENQEELRTALEKGREQKKQIKLLVSEKEQLICKHRDDGSQFEELQRSMGTLNEELENLRAKRDAVMLEKEASSQTHSEEMEKLQCRVTSLMEDRDQLLETLETLREEKKQLQIELEDRIQTVRLQLTQIQNKQTEMVTQELQVDDETLTQLQQELAETKSCLQSLQEEFQTKLDLIKLYEQKEAGHEQQMKVFSEELANARAERDAQKEESGPQQTEQLEKLQCRLTFLSEERDQLQETLEGLREEKKQLREEMEDKMQMMQCEFLQQLTSELQPLRDEREVYQLQAEQLEKKLENSKKEISQLKFDLQENVSLMAQLNMAHQTVTQHKQQLEDDLKEYVEKMSLTQELLNNTQNELHEQSNINSDLKISIQEKEWSLCQEIRDLMKKLKSVDAERNVLLSEKETNHQIHTEEMEKLQSRVTALSEERDHLQELLKALREEEKQLRAELEDKAQMITATQEKFEQQEQRSIKQQTEREEQEAMLQHKVQQLKEQLKIQTEQQACAEADLSQQLLNEAHLTISTLKEQLKNLEQNTKKVEDSVSSQLQDSVAQAQESFGLLQNLIDSCCRYNGTPLGEILRLQSLLKPSMLSTLPKATVKTHSVVYELGQKTVQNFLTIQEEIYLLALVFRKMFSKLVNKDLAIFEEKRLQDLLLSRVHAPTHSVKDVDFRSLWERRLSELLDKRQLYLQKMDNVSNKLWDNKAEWFLTEKAQLSEWEQVKEQVERVISSNPVSLTVLDSILSQEIDHRSSAAQKSTTALQLIQNENQKALDELKQLHAQSESQLREEKSKSSTLLQALEGAPLITEVSLLEENQKLVLQLQQAEGNVKILHAEIEELKEAQINANNRVSQHKQATQLLQTELQDSRALVQEKDDSIQVLKSKLRESEKKESLSPEEQETLHNKLFQMEVKLTSISDEHQQEIQRLKMVLSEKEESLRRMKEALRKSQQQGEESFLQGKELYDKLTHPRGVVIQSSIVLEKTKLEEKVQQLQLKITELESLVSSQQADISKWKYRAIKLKGKSKAEGDKMTSPSTPTKRTFSMTADSDIVLGAPKKFLFPSRAVLDSPKKDLESPRKLLDSPKFTVLNPTKSRLFDANEGSELLSRSRPRQFFDNTGLGFGSDAAVGAVVNEGSPPSEDLDINVCSQQ